jgi:hypothetical protein
MKFAFVPCLVSCLLCSLSLSVENVDDSSDSVKLPSEFVKSTDWVDSLDTFPCESFQAMESNEFVKQGCLSQTCGRRVVDGIFNQSDVAKLLAIANKGMSQRTDFGGPTILDINTGYIRDSKGLDNLFMKSSDIYTADDFAHYGRIISKLRETVMDTFHLSSLYFTAPTFITRINAEIPWKPMGIHDEYWHPHVDMNNTAHYQYSGLLYLSTYEEDFTGGKTRFAIRKF